MPDFAPTEEQEEIRKLASSLAVEQLRMQARSAERQKNIAPELQRTLMQTGLTTPFPEELGGSGAIEAVTYTLIAEELGYGDGSLTMNVIGSLMGPVSVSLAGNDAQKEEYLKLFSDEHTGHTQQGSLAFAERTGGYTLAEVSATARADDDNYILNGTKRDVIHGTQSALRVVLLRLEGTSGVDGICAFAIPDTDRPAGMRISEETNKLGLIAAPGASFTFEDATVPAKNMLGEPGNTGVIEAATLYAILRAGVACGMARAALEYASDYARGRTAFGRPIASYQGIAFMAAEMAMHLDAVRLLVWRAAATWDRTKDADRIPSLVREAEAAQQQAIALAKSATIDAVQILGGAGFLQDHPVEMWMRNAAAME